MRNSYLVFGQPLIEGAEIDEVAKSLRAAWLGTGPKLRSLKSGSRRTRGSRTPSLSIPALPASSGVPCAPTRAGRRGYRAGNDFCRDGQRVIHAGATPVLVDVEPDTFNMDPEQVRRRSRRKRKRSCQFILPDAPVTWMRSCPWPGSTV